MATYIPQKSEDSASADADQLVPIAVVRQSTPVDLSAGATNGDYEPLEIDASGRLWVNGSSVTQPVSAASLPLPTGAATETTLASRLSESDFDTKAGSLTETAPATDTASSGLNGRLQRIAQRITSLIALLPAALGAGGGLKVDGSGTALPVSAATLPLPSGAATEATLALALTIADFDSKTGSLTETAPATDTASSGLNGRLQRIAQRLTTLLSGGLPAALAANGGLKVEGIAGGVAQPVSLATLPALVAGSAAIGKLAANDGVDIGDVTVNNASGASAVNIQDGGNSITVDGTITATIAAGAATIAKAEDVASADADVGVPAMAVRKATPANTSGLDGDYEMLQMSAGRLWVSATIDAALPAGSAAIGKLAANSGVDIGDVDITSIAAGDNNIGNVDIVTMPAVVLAAGVAAVGAVTSLAEGGTADAAIITDTTGSVSGKMRGLVKWAFERMPAALAAGGGLKIEGVAAGVAVPASLATLPALVAGTAAIGKLAANSGVDIGDVDVTSIAAGDNNIGNVDIVTMPVVILGAGAAAIGAVTVSGDIAHDAVDSGNPAKIGGQARQTLPTAVADGDRANIITDDVGRQVVVPHAVRDLCADQQTALTSTTAVTTIVTADASNMLDLVGLILANTSTTGTIVTLYNDDGTTVRAIFYAPATDVRGIVFAVPFKQTAVNKTWKLKTTTSIASLQVTAQFIKNI